jgi:hypothetical protein
MTYLIDDQRPKTTPLSDLSGFQHPLIAQRPQFFWDLLSEICTGEISDSEGIPSVVDEAIPIAIVAMRQAFADDRALDPSRMKSYLREIAAEILNEIGCSTTVTRRTLEVRQLKSGLVSHLTDLPTLFGAA